MLAYINTEGTVCPLAYIGLHFAYIRFRPVLENRLFPTVAVYCPAAMNKTHISSHEKKLMNILRGQFLVLKLNEGLIYAHAPLNGTGHHNFFFSLPRYLRRRYVAVLSLQTGHLP